MKRIDFQHFMLSVGIASNDTVMVDVREELANLIYNNVSGIAALETAQKIYKSEGETEFDEREMDVITKTIEGLGKASFIDSFRNVVDNKL